MSTESTEPWRELALAHLPSLSARIGESKCHVDLWQNLKELLSEYGTREDRHDDAKVIYVYAWWCVNDSGLLWLKDEVEAYFYEDLPVYCDFDDQVPVHINEAQFEKLTRTFQFRLSDDEWVAFHDRYHRKRSTTS